MSHYVEQSVIGSEISALFFLDHNYTVYYKVSLQSDSVMIPKVNHHYEHSRCLLNRGPQMIFDEALARIALIFFQTC
jgi:hypothetical protein